MKIDIRMEKLIRNNSQVFNVIRKQNGHLDDGGNWIDEVDEKFESNFMVTTAKKEQENLINIGTTSYQVVKVRQMKDEDNLLQVNDLFVFNGFNFKIIKPKLYMEHVSDFYTWYAITEVDAHDKQ